MAICFAATKQMGLWNDQKNHIWDLLAVPRMFSTRHADASSASSIGRRRASHARKRADWNLGSRIARVSPSWALRWAKFPCSTAALIATVHAADYRSLLSLVHSCSK